MYFVCPFLAFVYHVPQFLEMHGTLTQFNCQPVEKKNHWQSQAFHCGSQKGERNSKYTIQVSIMEKKDTNQIRDMSIKKG